MVLLEKYFRFRFLVHPVFFFSPMDPFPPSISLRRTHAAGGETPRSAKEDDLAAKPQMAAVDGRNPIRTTWKQWLKLMFVGIYRGSDSS